MKLTKLVLIPLMFLACNGNPVTPDIGNQPNSYPEIFMASVQSNASILQKHCEDSSRTVSHGLSGAENKTFRSWGLSRLVRWSSSFPVIVYC